MKSWQRLKNPSAAWNKERYPIITIDDFEKVDIRIGRIIRAEEHIKARKPAYQLWVDFGEEIGIKQSSAQITTFYTRENLVGQYVVAVVNFPPRPVAHFKSEVLILGAIVTDEEIVLLQPDRPVPPGTKIA